MSDRSDVSDRVGAAKPDDSTMQTAVDVSQSSNRRRQTLFVVVTLSSHHSITTTTTVRKDDRKEEVNYEYEYDIRI